MFQILAYKVKPQEIWPKNINCAIFASFTSINAYTSMFYALYFFYSSLYAIITWIVSIYAYSDYLKNFKYRHKLAKKSPLLIY